MVTTTPPPALLGAIHLSSITKEQAQQWLDHTTYNRTIRERKVRFMRRDMNQGEWEAQVAPPIFIDTVTRGVIDGQHRLLAFLSSDLDSFLTYLAEVPRMSIEAIDTGTPKSLVDTLDIRGHQHATLKSAWLNRGVEWAVGGSVSEVLTRKDQVAIIESASNLEAASAIGQALKSGKTDKVLHIPSGVFMCLWDMQETHGLGGNPVVEFVTKLQTSQGLNETMRRLQAKLFDAANKGTKLTMSSDTKSYLIVRVFNAWANDQQLTRMYARKQAVIELPGYVEWVEDNFHTLL